MKKIMFNDKYGLTAAVLNGQKTMTRRIVKNVNLLQWLNELDDDGAIQTIKGTILSEENSAYKVGEIVAVAESYHELNKQGYLAPEWLDHTCEDSAGYDNKMFVRADLMPHRIRITDIKVERLQDISLADCLKEGIIDMITPKLYPTGNHVYTFEGNEDGCYYGNIKGYPTEIVAFARLIDKVSGKGTWNRNPWVFAYTFELVKGTTQ
jgi:hypothetical protein